ncbi:hypothetical protein DSECCO2_611400 [anaerobic digester metagenome]
MLALLVDCIELLVSPSSQVPVILHQEAAEGALGERFPLELAEIEINVGQIAESGPHHRSDFPLQSHQAFFRLTEYMFLESACFADKDGIGGEILIVQVGLDDIIRNAQQLRIKESHGRGELAQLLGGKRIASDIVVVRSIARIEQKGIVVQSLCKNGCLFIPLHRM